jgi:hypothetical protein
MPCAPSTLLSAMMICASAAHNDAAKNGREFVKQAAWTCRYISRSQQRKQGYCFMLHTQLIHCIACYSPVECARCDRARWLKQQRSRLVFGRCPVRVWARIPTILTKGFLLRSSRHIAWQFLKLSQGPFSPCFYFQFIIHCHPIIRCSAVFSY